jgi:predicted permease
MLPLVSARRGIQSDLGSLMRILLALGALVLLIVCANVANLQLARTTTRQREIAIRMGLGAGRRRIVAQHLTETAVLAAAACALAVLAGEWMVDALRLFTPFIEYPIALSPSIGAREIGYAGIGAAAAALLIGVWPAVRASGGNVVDGLKAGSRAAGLDRRTRLLRTGLVVVQISLATFAVTAAGLLVRSFQNARRADPGFAASGVLLAGINLSTGGYDRAAALEYLQRVVEHTDRLPGVSRVAFSEDVPLGFSGGSWEDIDVPGYRTARNEDMKVYRNLVSPGYFELMRIPLDAGRDFTSRDDAGAPMVAVVNEEFARRFFAGRPAVGGQFRAFGMPHRIVGVVRTSKYHTLAESPQPYFYLPLAQHLKASTGVALHVRSSGDPSVLGHMLTQELQRIDPRVPPPLVVTLEAYMGASYFAQRTAALLLGGLAFLALALSAVGLYALVAFNVAVREQEIGVRVALGAASHDIVRLVVAEGAGAAGWGIVGGCALTAAGTRALTSLLFGVSALDLPTLASAAAAIAGIALLSAYVPARAAARIDPTDALRED